LEPKVFWRTGDPERRLWLRFTVRGPSGEPMWLIPDPPLDGKLEIDGQVHDFREELHSLSTEAGEKTIADYLQRWANARNKLLYASEKGVPKIERDVISLLDFHRRNCFSLLALYILIDQTRSHQQFVVQALTAFLEILPGVRAKLTGGE